MQRIAKQLARPIFKLPKLPVFVPRIPMTIPVSVLRIKTSNSKSVLPISTPALKFPVHFPSYYPTRNFSFQPKQHKYRQTFYDYLAFILVAVWFSMVIYLVIMAYQLLF